MRTKSKGLLDSTPALGSYRDYYSSNGTPKGGIVQWSSPIYEGALYSISYDDSKRPRKIRTTRFCDHQRVEAENVHVNESYYTSPGTTYRVASHNLNPLGHATALSIPDVSSLHGEALQFFKAGCVSQEIDLGAFLAEFKQGVRLLPNAASTLSQLGSAIRNTSVKQTLKKSADLHLSYSFGLKPLISDVEALIGSARALQKKLAFLRKNSGKPVRVDFSKDLSSASTPGTTVIINNVNESLVIRNESYKCMYHAFATVIYDVSGISDLELQLKVLTRRFGLDKPLGTIWELTPWSFVVDWVFSLGQWLDRVTPAMTLPAKFLDLGYSVKVESRDILRLDRKFPKSGGTYHQARFQRSRYVRYPGLPVSFSSLDDSDLTLRQLALSASLSLQKWR